MDTDNTLPPYATKNDTKRCMVILENILENKGIHLNTTEKASLLLEIMNISYSKGGTYTYEEISSIAESYLKNLLNR